MKDYEYGKEQKVESLHDCKIIGDIANEYMIDNGLRVKNADTEIFFRNHEEHLIEFIESSEVIVGCVAWLTNENILKSLKKCKQVGIVVQKEDFLRPDMGTRPGWTNRLRKFYGELNGFRTRYDFKFLSKMSYGGKCCEEAIRCVGIYNYDKKPAIPRMHNKFIIGARIKRASFSSDKEKWDGNIIPEKVWTGCFNFTVNATRSYENVVIFRDKEIAEGYLKEYEQIMALSEPLDWKSNWVCPEWRIGE